MVPITVDKNGNSVGVGTVVSISTSAVSSKIGQVTEISFKRDKVTKEDIVLLKIAGFRGEAQNTDATCVEFTEFETILYNALSDRKAYLTEDETRELANELMELAKHELSD